jgi:predicted porin
MFTKPTEETMKKTLFVAAIAALSAVAAQAQSSVTIYGRFNESIESIDRNGLTTKELSNNASRIGFKGTEDLGGGLRAGFQLEHGFDASTGLAGSTFWGRQSEVNLSGAFGTVRLGRFTSEAYFATADYVSMHNHDTGNSEDELYAYIGRNQNKVAYRAPTMVKNLSLEAALSLAEGAAGETKNYDVAANYSTGPLALGMGYEKNDASNQLAVRALYDFGSFVAGGYVQRHKDAKLGNQTIYRISGMYVMGLTELHLNYGHAGAYSDLSGSDGKQFTAAINYNLSKRTKLFTYYTKLDSKFVSVNSPGYLSIGNRKSLALGIRHNF